MLPERTDSNWIATYKGRQFWPLNPRIEDLDIEDIARALSNLCRFTGHTRHHYSVAQHCYLASQWCPPNIAGWCLLHDAAEAYLNDIAKPVKRFFPLLVEAENATLELIAEKYGLEWPMPADVHVVDRIMLATERRDVMNSCGHRWNAVEGVQPYPEVIEAVPQQSAEALFLHRFGELFGFDY
jgi:uncharacterized protein